MDSATRSQRGLIDWEMLMAMHSLAGGLFRVNVMTSFEPLFLGPTGYPQLLQTGGTYQGARLVNHQHPHDLVSELAAVYDHSLTGGVAASLYAGVVGEPALGPVAYMHRPSAAADPFAPLGHHWQDASHESFGVITLGLYSRALKLEGSVFNAREPDWYHYNFDYTGARLDSYSGRVTLMPTVRPGLSAWAGYLDGARSARDADRNAALWRLDSDRRTRSAGAGGRAPRSGASTSITTARASTITIRTPRTSSSTTCRRARCSRPRLPSRNGRSSTLASSRCRRVETSLGFRAAI